MEEIKQLEVYELMDVQLEMLQEELCSFKKLPQTKWTKMEICRQNHKVKVPMVMAICEVGMKGNEKKKERNKIGEKEEIFTFLLPHPHQLYPHPLALLCFIF